MTGSPPSARRKIPSARELVTDARQSLLAHGTRHHPGKIRGHATLRRSLHRGPGDERPVGRRLSGRDRKSSKPTAILVADVSSDASHSRGPTTATSAASAACAVSQEAMISGPTPEGSPQVKASLLTGGVLRCGAAARANPRLPAQKTPESPCFCGRNFPGRERRRRDLADVTRSEIHFVKRGFLIRRSPGG